MPLPKISREREPQPLAQADEEEPVAKRPNLPPAPAGDAAPGRPYNTFVDSEARKYWQDMVMPGSLAKPAQQDVRRTAMRILGQALRNRYRSRRHHAVDAMRLHAVERGWVKPPYSSAGESPGYIEALIELSRDAGWLAHEIPLPVHQPPRHPPIYYRIDPRSRQPVPTKESVISGNYVSVQGCPISGSSIIHPWLDPGHLPNSADLISRNRTACYTLYFNREKAVEVLFHWVRRTREGDICISFPVGFLQFSPPS